MTKSILKAVICGALVGVMAFFVPHLLIGILVFSFIVRLFHCGGRHHGCCGHGHYGHNRRMFYMADMIRKMNEEEYAEFKTNMGGGCCNNGAYHQHGCCGSKSNESGCYETKKEETTK